MQEKILSVDLELEDQSLYEQTDLCLYQPNTIRSRRRIGDWVRLLGTASLICFLAMSLLVFMTGLYSHIEYSTVIEFTFFWWPLAMLIFTIKALEGWLVSKRWRGLPWVDFIENTGLRPTWSWELCHTVLEGEIDGRIVRVFPERSLMMGWSYQVQVPVHRALPNGCRVEASLEAEETEFLGLGWASDRREELLSVLSSIELEWMREVFSDHPGSVLDQERLSFIALCERPHQLGTAVHDAIWILEALEEALDRPWRELALAYELVFVQAPAHGHPMLHGFVGGLSVQVQVEAIDRDYQTLMDLGLPFGVPDWRISAGSPDQGIRTGHPIADSCLRVESSDPEQARRMFSNAAFANRLVALLCEFPGSTIDGWQVRLVLPGDAGPRLDEILRDVLAFVGDLRRLGELD
jgi:hypothetical protein